MDYFGGHHTPLVAATSDKTSQPSLASKRDPPQRLIVIRAPHDQLRVAGCCGTPRRPLQYQTRRLAIGQSQRRQLLQKLRRRTARKGPGPLPPQGHGGPAGGALGSSAGLQSGVAVCVLGVDDFRLAHGKLGVGVAHRGSGGLRGDTRGSLWVW